MIKPKYISWLTTVFFVVIIAVVFQQIYTSMTEQGIASGGPYDNAAAYPGGVAIVIGVLVLAQALIDNFRTRADASNNTGILLGTLQRPALLLLLFAVYLALLKPLGYHLTTTPMIFAMMWLCGARRIWNLLLAAVAMSFAFAYIFENFLNVVLPGGFLRLNIPW